MLKKLLAICLLLSVLLAGCAPKATPAPTQPAAEPKVVEAATVAPPAEKIELSFSHFWTEADGDAGKIVKARLDAWQAAHPDVEVKMEVISHDEYYNKFRVLVSSSELPDVFIMNADMTTPVSISGQLLDLTEALKADSAWNAILNPGLMGEWTREGKVYALPSQVIMTHQIFYNTEIFKEVGIDKFPATWAEMTGAITKLKEAGYTPIALGAKGGWPLYDCLFGTLSFRATGVDWYNRLLAREAQFTDPEFVYALTSLEELVKLGAFNPDATSLDNMQARTLYYERKAAMFIEGGWAIAGALDLEEVESVTDIGIWPALPEGKGQPNEVTWASGWGWAANAKLTGAEREAAISLLKALSDEAYGKMRLEHGLGAPQLITEFDGSKLPRLFTVENNYSANWQAVPILTLGFPSSVTDVISNGLQEILTGQKSPAEVAKAVQAEYELTK